MNMVIKSLVTFILLWFAAPVWAQDLESNGPKAVVENAVNGILHALESRSNPKTLTEKDREAIRQQVAGRFDYHEMARRSVGKTWKQQNTQQQAEFTETFRQLLERSYGNRLSKYHGQTVEFDGAEFKKNKARVKTRVIDSNKVTPVFYRLHQTAGAWQVYDIKIEGVSLVGTFRKDFKGPLKKDGFEALLKALQDKVARLKQKDAS